jgi:molybdopterin/thiamine biosynthesis adenylyltransferase
MSRLYDRQEKLKLNTDQTVTVVGCGGIGFWVIKFLAMSGIEKIHCFDNDVIEEHNLNRLDIPHEAIGMNKADVIKTVVNQLRPDCTLYAFPFIFNDSHKPGTDWLIDCTDKLSSQVENQKIANAQGMKYVKAGYDGEDFSIHNSVAEWGEAEDGYITVPSWVVPATVIASMTVAKVLKYPEAEMVSNLKGVFTSTRRS